MIEYFMNSSIDLEALINCYLNELTECDFPSGRFFELISKIDILISADANK